MRALRQAQGPLFTRYINKGTKIVIFDMMTLFWVIFLDKTCIL